jgi:hypothetical protein
LWIAIALVALVAIALLTGRRYEFRMEWRDTLNILLRPPAAESRARDDARISGSSKAP